MWQNRFISVLQVVSLIVTNSVAGHNVGVENSVDCNRGTIIFIIRLHR